MSNQRWKGKLYLLGASCLFCSSLFGQVIDTTSYHKLSDVEVIGHRKPSVLKSSAPIQILNNRSFEQLGLQDLSDAVKRFSGVSVQDYGGIGGLKTVSVRSLGAKHTAVSYDGVTITDMQSGQVDISRFSLDDVEMVSLSIGQADDIFQSARVLASAGTLSIQTRSPYLEEDILACLIRTCGMNSVWEKRMPCRYKATGHGRTAGILIRLPMVIS